jgi:hypothetical protein
MPGNRFLRKDLEFKNEEAVGEGTKYIIKIFIIVPFLKYY